MLKRFASGSLRMLFRNLRFLATEDLRSIIWHRVAMDKSIRGISSFAMRERLELAAMAPAIDIRSELNRHEFRIFSQNGEDGILLWLFSKIGTTSKGVVEFGIGNGRECITTNLILNFGWHGLLMDGSLLNVKSAIHFFKQLMSWDEFEPLDIRQCFVTKDNIDDLIKDRKDKREPDLLVVDIDGNDYWVWEAITSISPRVVVMEYNSVFGPEDVVTVPYKENFDTYAEHPLGLYHGASLAALVKLGKKKGYYLAGCDAHGCNAFFLRNEFIGKVPEISAGKAFYENAFKLKRGSMKEQRTIIRDKPLISV